MTASRLVTVPLMLLRAWWQRPGWFTLLVVTLGITWPLRAATGVLVLSAIEEVAITTVPRLARERVADPNDET